MSTQPTDAPKRDPREISWPLEFPLSKVVTAHDEEIKALVLQEPTGDDVLKFGLLEGLDASQFFPLVAKLARVPEGTLRKIGAREILQLGTILNRFFAWAALPPEPSTTASS